MSQLWYYVQDGERIGPVAQEELLSLIKHDTLDSQSYVWRKGFADWMHIEQVEELKAIEIEKEQPQPIVEIEQEQETVEPVVEAISVEDDFSELEFEAQPEQQEEVIEEVELKEYSFKDFDLTNSLFFIRTGADRGEAQSEYGPFRFPQIKQLISEKRINEKTLVFTSSMDHWLTLGAFEDFESQFNQSSSLSDQDKRLNQRKPFVARMFFSNRSEVFEGICRDISIGGMQVLLDHYPGQPGDKISINVHPENTEHSFIADGKVVRVLEGKKGFSFRFIDPTQEAVNAINKYINSEE